MFFAILHLKRSNSNRIGQTFRKLYAPSSFCFLFYYTSHLRYYFLHLECRNDLKNNLKHTLLVTGKIGKKLWKLQKNQYILFPRYWSLLPVTLLYQEGKIWPLRLHFKSYFARCSWCPTKKFVIWSYKVTRRCNIKTGRLRDDESIFWCRNKSDIVKRHPVKVSELMKSFKHQLSRGK